MIISHKFRYVFVEVPNTGSNAIGKVLLEHFDGQRILCIHANVSQFLKIASPTEREYFFFATVRNPLDTVVSDYLKLKNNHAELFTNPARRIENGGGITAEHLRQFSFIQETNADFPAFLRRYQNYVYNNWTLIGHKVFDYVLRYERLNEEFEKVIRKIGQECVNSLPFVNRTSGKMKSFEEYFTPEIYELAIRNYGPFMLKWGYSFPEHWPDIPVPLASRLRFSIMDRAVNTTARFMAVNHHSPLVTRLKSIVNPLL